MMTVWTLPELPQVAVVEDEPDLRASMVDFLRACRYPVWAASCGEEFFRILPDSPVDVVVLDIQLPGEDGFAIAERLRARIDMGIIIASAREQLSDRLTGLNSGADVYLVKPVDLRELVANIQSVFRRLNRNSNDSAEPASAPWVLDMQDWMLQASDGGSLSLSPKEFLMVRTLVEGNGEVVSKARIAGVLGGDRGAAGVDYHAIDVLIARLRKKCQEVLGCPLPIRTVTGIGFMLTVPAELRNR
jgi:DNA-binding response OmpR family regulator